MNGFQKQPDQAISRIQQLIPQLGSKNAQLPTLSAQSVELSKATFNLSPGHLQYILTDLSQDQAVLRTQLGAFIQNKGAVGIASFESGFIGSVQIEQGQYYHRGPRRLYLLIAGEYEHVQHAISQLRDHPQSQGIFKANELTIFVQEKLIEPGTFLTESTLGQFKSTLQDPSAYPVLNKLKAGIASQEAKRNRELNDQSAESQFFSSYFGHDLRRANLFQGNCQPPRSLSLRIKNELGQLQGREVFLINPRYFAPRIYNMYAEAQLSRLNPNKPKADKSEAEAKESEAPDAKQTWRQHFESVSLPANTLLVTHKQFESIWQRVTEPALDLPTGSPFHAQLPIGAFVWQIPDLKSLRSNTTYELNIRLYPSKTGQDTREKASDFYLTGIPVASYGLNAQQLRQCQTGQSTQCGASYGFAGFYEHLLKASIPTQENSGEREVIAEFNYYFQRSK